MPSIDTLYGKVDTAIVNQCANLRLLVLDVDGVLSDGAIYLGNHGEELKAFNSKDGYGIKALANIGVDIAVITGRQSSIVQTRMSALHTKYIIQGCEDKQGALKKLIQEYHYREDEVASIGDDVPDIGLFELSVLKVAVNDAHPLVKEHANLVLSLDGGRGAVREFCDLVLQAKGELYNTHGASI